MQEPLDVFLHRFADDLGEINRVLNLSMDGIAKIAHEPKVVAALEAWETARGQALPPDEAERRRIAAHQRAEFATAELSRGFPVLHAHAVVALWGALEALVEDVVVAILESSRDLLTSERFAKLMIPIGEYESMEPSERLRFIVKELSRKTNSDLKRGIGRFEAVLAYVEMQGQTVAETRRDLLELSNVRNLLVHRRGVIDRQFAEACPWLSAPLGERLVVSHADHERYMGAVNSYFTSILRRDLLRRGLSTEGFDRGDSVPGADGDERGPLS